MHKRFIKQCYIIHTVGREDGTSLGNELMDGDVDTDGNEVKLGLKEADGTTDNDGTMVGVKLIDGDCDGNLSYGMENETVSLVPKSPPFAMTIPSSDML